MDALGSQTPRFPSFSPLFRIPGQADWCVFGKKKRGRALPVDSHPLEAPERARERMKTKPKRRAPDGTRLGRLGNLSRKFLRFSDGHQFAVTQIVCCVRKDRRSSRAPPGLCHRRGHPHRQGNYSKYPPLARRISLGSYIVGWRSVYHVLQSNLQWTAPSAPMDSRKCIGALRKVHRWTWGQCIGALRVVNRWTPRSA